MESGVRLRTVGAPGIRRRVAGLHPDDRDTLRLMHAMAIAGANAGRYQLEYRLLQPDGGILGCSPGAASNMTPPATRS